MDSKNRSPQPPSAASSGGGVSGDVGASAGKGRDYWRQCMRGLDYLSGHADGYGEQRIGADCHGVPVYANRKGAWRTPWSSRWRCRPLGMWSGTTPARSGIRAIGTHEQPYSLHGVSEEPSWFPNQSYQEVYKEEECQDQVLLTCQSSKISVVACQPSSLNNVAAISAVASRDVFDWQLHSVSDVTKHWKGLAGRRRMVRIL